MKTQTGNALAYVQNMLSFVFQNKTAGEKIKVIYLFGSAVRGELVKSSDIDLFAECEKKDEREVQQVINSGIVKFTSSRDYQKWKLFHFTYPFSLQVGKLQEWDLKLSIASEGLLLYSKKTSLSLGNRMVLFILQYPKKKIEYMRLRRMLFGRDEKNQIPSGEILLRNGKKLCSHIFLIPKEEQTHFIHLLSKEKAEFSMKEITLLES